MTRSLIYSLVFLLVSCASSSSTAPDNSTLPAVEISTDAPTQPPAVTVAAKLPEPWDYSLNGADWVNRDDECALAGRQSPINIVSAVSQAANADEYVQLDLTDKAFVLEKDEKLGLVMKSANSTSSSLGTLYYRMSVGDREYDVVRAVLKTPGEHTFEGPDKRTALEVQFEAQGKGALKSQSAVIAFTWIVHAKTGQPHAFLQAVVSKGLTFSSGGFEIGEAGVSSLFQRINLNVDSANTSVIPNEAFYRYEGSISHPPCTENTVWLVQKQPFYATQEMVNAVRKIVLASGGAGNFRVVQNTDSTRQANSQPLVTLRLERYRTPPLKTLKDFLMVPEVIAGAAVGGIVLAASFFLWLLSLKCFAQCCPICKWLRKLVRCIFCCDCGKRSKEERQQQASLNPYRQELVDSGSDSDSEGELEMGRRH